MEHEALRYQQKEEMNKINNALEIDNNELKRQLRASTEMIELTRETLRTWQETSQRDQSTSMQYFIQAKRTITVLRETLAEKDERLAKLGINPNSSRITSKLNSSEENHVATTDNVKSDEYHRHTMRSKEDFGENVMQISEEEGDGTQLNNCSSKCKQHRNNERELIQSLKESVARLESDLLRERDKKQQLSDSLQYLREKYDELLNECELILEKESRTESTVNGLQKEVDSLTERLSPADLVMRDDLLARVDQLESQIGVMRAQAEIYRTNVENERKARERMNVERLKLQQQVDFLNGELHQKLKNQPSSAESAPSLLSNTINNTPRSDSASRHTVSK